MTGTKPRGGPSTDWSAPVSCADIVIDTQLGSPKPAVIAGIAVGEVLVVAVQVINGVRTVVVLRNGDLAGGLASPQATDLRECIDKGFRYGATVTDVSGGQVRVRVAQS